MAGTDGGGVGPILIPRPAVKQVWAAVAGIDGEEAEPTLTPHPAVKEVGRMMARGADQVAEEVAEVVGVGVVEAGILQARVVATGAEKGAEVGVGRGGRFQAA